jgi:inosose dehydratase
MISRREFLVGLGAAAAAALSARADARQSNAIKFGYAAITWEDDHLKAIDDIAAVGFKGIQLRSPVLESFGDRPGELKALLANKGLIFVALSSGGIRIDPELEAEELAKHTWHAKFLSDAGGLYLQLTDTRPRDRAIVAADYERLGRLLTDVGKRAADVGVTLAYHNHMNNLGERPEEVRAILDAADPRYVKLLLDTAHYQQGGGDPIEAIKTYRDRLLFLHIKDLEAPVPGATGDLSRSYRFVELGRGKVDLKGVFATLRDIKFRGWAVVELDRVPDPGRTPKESALISKKYLEDVIGMKI